MRRQVIRLTESDLHKIIRESVKRALREGYHDNQNDEDDDFFNPDGNPPKFKRFGKRKLKEEGMAGGGATNCANVMQTGSGKAPLGTNPEAGQYTVPFGADAATADRHPGFSVDGKSDVQRRQIYNPKSGKKK